MKRKYKAGFLPTALVGALALVACSDWNGHYEASSRGQDISLYDLLLSFGETSVFASLVKEAGYDQALSASQTYTVFAPTDAVLSGENFDTTKDVKRIVENHVARYLWPSGVSAGKGVRMLNDKIYYFGSGTDFSGSAIISADNPARNGILHEMDGRIPYVENIMEYMASDDGTSEIYNFISGFDETKFDSENSIEKDIDAEGRPVYDTITVKYNRLLEDKTYGIGNIASEDSAYTMIVPDNGAWRAAYERISPSFKVYDANPTRADSIQDIRTRLAIVRDLVIRGEQPLAASEDSLVTTSGSVLSDPAFLLGDSEPVTASNGYVFPASSLNYDNTETWNKPITVEAEEQNGRTYNNTTTSLYSRTPDADTEISVSGGGYIEVQPLTASSNPSVVFDIPDVLAGKYDVYAVFLPSIVAGASEEPDSTKLSFTMTYLNDNGRQNTKTAKTSDLVTLSRERTVMLAFEAFEFPVSDTTDVLWLMDEENDESDVETNTQLTVSTNVTTSEYTKGTYSRTFRLDRIILYPAKIE